MSSSSWSCRRQEAKTTNEHERNIHYIFGTEADGLRVTMDAEGRLVYSMPRKKSKRREPVDDQEVKGAAAE